ncbi:MAG: hypothetical protein NVS4B3_07950 [Gemmatimonadaceae bacterium]
MQCNRSPAQSEAGKDAGRSGGRNDSDAYAGSHPFPKHARKEARRGSCRKRGERPIEIIEVTGKTAPASPSR